MEERKGRDTARAHETDFPALSVHTSALLGVASGDVALYIRSEHA